MSIFTGGAAGSLAGVSPQTQDSPYVPDTGGAPNYNYSAPVSSGGGSGAQLGINASTGNTNTTSNTNTLQNAATTGYQNSTTNSSATNSGVNANTYNASQLAAQGQLGQQYSDYLQNGIPQSFAAPQAELNAYQQQFQNLVAPGIAAQQGGGAAGIGMSNTLGLSQLLGSLYNTQSQNYLTGLGQEQQMAYTPIGNTYSGQQNQTSNTSGTYGSNTTQSGVQNNNGTTNGNSLSVLQQLSGL